MSSHSQKISRKRKHEETTTMDSSSSDTQSTLFVAWLDKGLEGKNGETEYEGFSLTVGGKTLDVSIGDAVLVRGSGIEDQQVEDEKSEKVGYEGRMMIARVERIWDTKNNGTGECPYMFQARWFLRKSDLQSLQGDITIPSWDLDLIHRITEDDDLILSNQADDNALTTIAGNIQVVYRRPESDKSLPSLPDEMFICRYCIAFNPRIESSSEGFVRIMPFVGKDDRWEDCVTSNGERATNIIHRQDDHEPSKERLPSISSPSTTSSKKRLRFYSEDSVDGSTDEPHPTGGSAVIGEGTVDARNTRVGRKHQVSVPRYDANHKPTTVSRNPKPVWKPGQVSRDTVQSYMTKAAGILIPYLEQEGLTHTVPYSPLAWEEMEALTKEMNSGKLPTLSTICTASALAEKRTDMLREVDTGALMQLLHEHSYDAEDALRAIEATPKKFVTAMTGEQKNVVDFAFRRYAGSFRMSYKALAPAKSFQEVIDYLYRFKIPDQFRLFQETKRELAVQMLESIESRRNVHACINADKVPAERPKVIEWQKTSVLDMTENLDNRRAQAKRLLLDIIEELGNDTMKEVALLIKNFHRRPAIESRTRLLAALHGSQDLKQRMIEFLPKRF